MEAPWQAEVNRRKEHQPKGFFRGRFTAAVGGDEKWQDIFKLMDVNGEHVENIWENHYEWIRVGFVSDSCRIRVGSVSDSCRMCLKLHRENHLQIVDCPLPFLYL